MRILKIFLVLLIVSFFPTLVLGEPFTASLYEVGSNKEKLLFNQKGTEQYSGDETKVEVFFTDSQGQVAVKENAVLKGGNAIQYSLINSQNGDQGSIEVKDGRLWFTFTHDGKTKKDDEKWVENFVVPPSVVAYLKKHWNEILSGKDVDVRIGALERAETVGFKFFKIKESRSGDVDLVTVKMKPTSFIIAALVDPLIFTIEKNSVRLVELTGRTLPKKKSGEKWKDLDADVFFKY